MKQSNLAKRIVSAAILAPIVLYVIHVGGLPYKLLIMLVAILMALEWTKIIGHANLGPAGRFFWGFLGLCYIIIPCSCLIFMRDLDQGRDLVFWMLFAIWATDTGAYISGRLIGGPKLAPKISPKKTWAGLVGGVLSAVFVGLVFTKMGFVATGNTPINCALIAIIGQLGDLVESAFKRRFGVKDSGNIIPGHGGVLDRLDSVVTVSIYVTILQYLYLCNS